MTTAIDLSDLLTLSPAARKRWHDWWEPTLGDVCADLNIKPSQDHADIYVAGDSQYLHTMSKRAYRKLTLWPTITHLIQYLDDHGLYRDPKTGTTHADGIAAADLCDWLWSRVKAHLEHADDPEPLPVWVGRTH